MNPESRRRRKDYDRDRERDRDRDRNADYSAYSPRSQRRERPRTIHRSTSTRSVDGARDRQQDRHDSYSSDSTTSQDYSPRKSSNPRPSINGRKTSSGLLERTRSSQSYPAFSKEHSRESTTSRPNSDIRQRDAPYTPDPTDFGDDRNGSPRVSQRKQPTTGAPPSPPLTNVDANVRRAGSGGSLRAERARPAGDIDRARRSVDTLNLPRDGVRFSASRYSLREAEEGRSSVNLTPNSSAAGKSDTARSTGIADTTSRGYRSPFAGSPTRNPQPRHASGLRPTSAFVESNIDSDTTAVPNGTAATTIINSPQESIVAGSRWQNGDHNRPNSGIQSQTPVIEVFASVGTESEFAEPLDVFDANSSTTTAQPPPPPPPVSEPIETPRIDYALKHGGLPVIIKQSFSKAPEVMLQQAYPNLNPRSPNPDMFQSVFAPYQVVLDNLEKVLSMNGSVAVATGYKSQTRDLQDRMKAFFERDIAKQTCTCAMCELNRQNPKSKQSTTVTWEEILSLISGRVELPPWPPFVHPTSLAGLGIDLDRAATPMQRLDIDVPEEFREHYLRQSAKTKNQVQGWLADQSDEGPPADVDDETLTFAMLTYLAPEDRRVFAALSRGLSTIPPSRAPTPAQTGVKTDQVSRIGLALERLYHLPKPPREPESCMYLLRNPTLHNALVTIAAIKQSEWDMLTSGQLDGILPTDPQNTTDGVHPPSRSTTPALNNSLRATTPFSPTPGGVPLPSANQTPSAPPPQLYNIAHTFDSENELSMLSHVERDIYLGMEALEDAFEQLHLKAESVRMRLLERSAGLAAAARGSGVGGDVGVRMGTPALGVVNGATNLPSAPLPASTNGHITTSTNNLQNTLNSARGRTPAPNLTSASPFPRQQIPDANWLPTGAFGTFDPDDTASLVPDDSASNIGWRERDRRQRDRMRSSGGWGGRGVREREGRDGRGEKGGISGERREREGRGGDRDGGRDGREKGEGKEGKEGSGTGTGIGLGGLGKRLTRRLRTGGERIDVVREE